MRVTKSLRDRFLHLAAVVWLAAVTIAFCVENGAYFLQKIEDFSRYAGTIVASRLP